MKKNQITKTDNASLASMDLLKLLEIASNCVSDLKGNALMLGGVLSEIGNRYGSDGIQVCCEEIGFTRTTAARLVAAYHGTTHISIAIGVIPHANRIEALPIQEQTEIIEKGVPMVVSEGKAYKTKRVPLAEIERRHIEQLFDGNQIRSEKAQLAYVKERQAEAKKESVTLVDERPDWEVKNGKLVIHNHKLKEIPVGDIIKQVKFQ
jgi:hypothetical protein